LENKYHLFIEYEGTAGFFKGEEYDRLIKIKNKAYFKLAEQGYYLLESIKIFSESMEDFIIFLEKNKSPYFSHLATGVFYILFMKGEEKQREVLDFAKRLKSVISYNTGYGMKNKEYVPDKEIMRRVKLRHDPNSKFSKNKLIDFKIKKEDLFKFNDKKENQIELGEPEKAKENKAENEAQEIIDNITEEQIREKQSQGELAI
jgi:hypothetical protein